MLNRDVKFGLRGWKTTSFWLFFSGFGLGVSEVKEKREKNMKMRGDLGWGAWGEEMRVGDINTWTNLWAWADTCT